MKVSVHKKVWGHETWLVNCQKYCGKILHFNAEHQSSLHYHKKKDETFYVLKGSGYLQLNKRLEVLLPGVVFRIKPGVIHRFIAYDDLDIIEVSTKHYNSDSIRLQKGY